MAERESKVSLAEPPADRDRGSRPSGESAAPRTERQTGGGNLFTIHKPGQGTYVRWGSAIGGGAIAVFFAAFLAEQLRLFTQGLHEQTDLVLRTLIPAAVLVGLAYLIFWLVGRNQRTVEFMIATEGEMKKVNWSTRREIWGATRVVIFTVFALALILAIVDLFFIVFFSGIGVLRMNIIENLFKAGQNAT